MKFLPFDEDDMRRLDKLIAQEDLLHPSRVDIKDKESLREWKRKYNRAYRFKKKFADSGVELKPEHFERKSR